MKLVDHLSATFPSSCNFEYEFRDLKTIATVCNLVGEKTMSESNDFVKIPSNVSFEEIFEYLRPESVCLVRIGLLLLGVPSFK